MNKVIFLMLFSINIFSQDLRYIDRSLKTMINMHNEIDSISSMRMDLVRSNIRLKALVESCKDDFDDSVVELNKLKEINLTLVDSLNHYKVLDYGNNLKLQLKESREKELKRSIRKRDLVIAGGASLVSFLIGIFVL